MKIHSIAAILPEMSKVERKDLNDDIKQNGLREPITIYQEQILDGRHRYTACCLAKIKPQFVELPDGIDPVAFVVSKNLKRRNLTVDQLGIIGAKLSNLSQGRPENKPARLPVKQSEAAKTLGISERTVRKAAAISKADPKLAKQVANGEITLHAAGEKVKEAAKAKMEVVDERGHPIPMGCMEVWNRREEIQKLLNQLSAVKCAIEKAVKANDPVYRWCSQETVAKLTFAYGNLSHTKPYAVCPYCQGRDESKASCSACVSLGIVSDFGYDLSLKKLREMHEARLKEKRK